MRLRLLACLVAAATVGANVRSQSPEARPGLVPPGHTDAWFNRTPRRADVVAQASDPSNRIVFHPSLGDDTASGDWGCRSNLYRARGAEQLIRQSTEQYCAVEFGNRLMCSNTSAGWLDAQKHEILLYNSFHLDEASGRKMNFQGNMVYWNVYDIPTDGRDGSLTVIGMTTDDSPTGEELRRVSSFDESKAMIAALKGVCAWKWTMHTTFNPTPLLNGN